jgi:hypothetical protein
MTGAGPPGQGRTPAGPGRPSPTCPSIDPDCALLPRSPLLHMSARACAEVRRELRTALGELLERQRTVVELRDVHRLSSEDSCERLEDVYRGAMGEGARHG